MIRLIVWLLTRRWVKHFVRDVRDEIAETYSFTPNRDERAEFILDQAEMLRETTTPDDGEWVVKRWSDLTYAYSTVQQVSQLEARFVLGVPYNVEVTHNGGAW